MTYRILASGLLLVFLFLGGAAGASTPAETPDNPDSGFHLGLTPYLWCTGLHGKVGISGLQTSVNSNITDPAKYLLIYGLNLDAIYQNRLGLLADIDYCFLDSQSTKSKLSLNTNLHLILGDIAAYWRLGTADLGQQGQGTASLDLLAGARIWSLALGDKLTPLLIGGTATREFDWVDPIVGARVLFRLGKKWTVSLRAGIGGFGLSSASTADAQALIGYTFWEPATISLGYRAIGVTHTGGGGLEKYTLNMIISGPMAGLTLTF